MDNEVRIAGMFLRQGMPVPKYLQSKLLLKIKPVETQIPKAVASRIDSTYGTAKMEKDEARKAFAFHRSDKCQCCGKTRKNMKFHTSIRGFLCGACEKKVTTLNPDGTVNPDGFVVDHLNLYKARDILERERMRTAVSNAEWNKQRKPNDEHCMDTPCPYCGVRKHTEQIDEKRWYCALCGREFSVRQTAKGVEVSYPTYDEQGQRIEGVTRVQYNPAPEVKEFKCGCCGEVRYANRVVSVTDRKSGKRTVICEDCLAKGIRLGIIKAIDPLVPDDVPF